MTKETSLEIIKLLSALQSWSFANKQQLPDYLHDRLVDVIAELTVEVLQ